MFCYAFPLILASTCQGQKSGGSYLKIYSELKDTQSKIDASNKQQAKRTYKDVVLNEDTVSKKKQRVVSDDNSSDEEYVDIKLSNFEIGEINKRNKQRTAKATKARLQSE